MMGKRYFLLSEDTRAQGRTWRKISLDYVYQILFVHTEVHRPASQTEAQKCTSLASVLICLPEYTRPWVQTLALQK